MSACFTSSCRRDRGGDPREGASCDHAGCTAKIKPNPDIANSGWIKCGVLTVHGRTDYDYCPDHAGDAFSYDQNR